VPSKLREMAALAIVKRLRLLLRILLLKMKGR
jgi:hypothetical protein